MFAFAALLLFTLGACRALPAGLLDGDELALQLREPCPEE